MSKPRKWIRVGEYFDVWFDVINDDFPDCADCSDSIKEQLYKLWENLMTEEPEEAEMKLEAVPQFGSEVLVTASFAGEKSLNLKQDFKISHEVLLNVAARRKQSIRQFLNAFESGVSNIACSWLSEITKERKQNG